MVRVRVRGFEEVEEEEEERGKDGDVILGVNIVNRENIHRVSKMIEI